MQHGSETRERENLAASVTPEMLDEVVRRIVEAVHPRRIILFGSAARGAMGPDSDLDLLVVMPDGTHRRQAGTEIFRALRGVGLPKDVVVVTEGDVREHRSNPSLVIKPAFGEGVALYVAA
jgi:predicted nucleotidyltransferase